MFAHIKKMLYLCSRKRKRNKLKSNPKIKEKWKRNKTKPSTNKLAKVVICTQFATFAKAATHQT